jgi:uncharacterized protein rv1991c/MT2046
MIRGEIYWADYGIPYGSEPGFKRPVVIVQNDAFNIKELHTVLAVPLTTNIILADAPGNVFIDKIDSGLPKDSVAVVSQTGVIDKARISEKVGILPFDDMHQIDAGLCLILGLN